MKVPIMKVNDELGIVIAWGYVASVDGETYVDSQGDSVEPDAFIEASMTFAKAGSPLMDTHTDTQIGEVVAHFPITKSMFAALGLNEPNIEGVAIIAKPTPEALAKVKSGEFTGFSIGGTGS